MQRKKPNFLCLGAQKSGTTSLYFLLKRHPQVFLPQKKELHFFDNPENYKKGEEFYSSHFEEAKPHHKVIGEITPDYMIYNFVPQRIMDFLGKDLKLVFVLREPVERMYSQYNHYRNAEVETIEGFDAAMERDIEDIENLERKNWHDPPYYKSRGFYYNQIKRFEELFGKEQIHICFFEELFIHKSRKALANLLLFLEIEYHDLFRDEVQAANRTVRYKSRTSALILHITRRKYFLPIITFIKLIMPKSLYGKIKAVFFERMQKYPEVLSKETRDRYKNLFKEDKLKLEQFLGSRIDCWE